MCGCCLPGLPWSWGQIHSQVVIAWLKGKSFELLIFHTKLGNLTLKATERIYGLCGVVQARSSAEALFCYATNFRIMPGSDPFFSAENVAPWLSWWSIKIGPASLFGNVRQCIRGANFAKWLAEAHSFQITHFAFNFPPNDFRSCGGAPQSFSDHYFPEIFTVMFSNFFHNFHVKFALSSFSGFPGVFLSAVFRARKTESKHKQISVFWAAQRRRPRETL